MDEPAAVEGVGVVRAQPQRLVAVGERGLQPAEDGARPAPVVPPFGDFRLYRHELVVARDRLFVVAFALVGGGTVAERRRIGGIDAQGRVVVGDGAVVIAGEPMNLAAVVVGSGKFRIDADRLAVIGEGARIFRLGTIGFATVVVGGRVVGIEPDRRGVIGNGPVVVQGTESRLTVI